MNLEKYTGSVSEGTYTARIPKVELGRTKAGDPQFEFTAHFRDLEVDQKIRYPLKESMLWKLQQDLSAAEVLREGDAYSDDPNAMAQEIQDDLSDRFVLIDVKPQKSNPQFMDMRIVGVALNA